MGARYCSQTYDTPKEAWHKSWNCKENSRTIATDCEAHHSCPTGDHAGAAHRSTQAQR